MIPVRQYNGDQVILSSGRIIFNSKDDNIILSTKKDTVITSAGSVHINVGPSSGAKSDVNYFILNAKKIQLGLNNVQPVPKGDNLVKALNDILKALNELATNLTSATGIGVGTVAEPTVNAAGVKLQGQIQNISSEIENIKSKITFTE